MVVDEGRSAGSGSGGGGGGVVVAVVVNHFRKHLESRKSQ